MCGAAWKRRSRQSRTTGLSPRVRGSRRADLVKQRKDLRWVYPHVCGAALLPSRTSGVRTRSIPTCAGQPNQPIPQDHHQGGLSPRVRGSLVDRQSVSGTVYRPAYYGVQWQNGRSIPTCAGQPAAAAVDPGAGLGLSPRVRGSPMSRASLSLRWRSIPTCAGQPRSCHRAHWCTAVYPHVCGAACMKLRATVRFTGLSPRVRGSLKDQSVNHTPRRVYPHVCGAAIRSSGAAAT